MVGIVTFDDAMDVMVDEATEDITKMAAINPSEKTYFDTSVFQHAMNRIPWLLILMLTSIITGTIITKYENAFAAIPLLVSFIPMLMDTGGNCGSQSATLQGCIQGVPYLPDRRSCTFYCEWTPDPDPVSESVPCTGDCILSDRNSHYG